FAHGASRGRHADVPSAMKCVARYVLLAMTKLQSSLDAAIEMLRDLEELRASSEAFRKQLREEFVRRSGAASLDEALATALAPLVLFYEPTIRRKASARSPKPRKPDR